MSQLNDGWINHLRSVRRQEDMNKASSNRQLNTTARALDQRTSFYIEGVFNGVETEAYADTGAAFNVISRQLADSMSLPLQPETGGHLALPTGRKIFTPGRVHGTFKVGFDGKSYDISLIVLDTAAYPLVLGSKFLRLTRAFTQFKTQLKRVVSSVQRIGLNLLGDGQEAVSGYLNKSNCLALPDSGSNITILSGAFAKAHGFKVQRDEHYRIPVEFIDGSRGRVDGIVKDAAWQFREGGENIPCDFHVMDNLVVDAILSNTLVDEHDIFARYDDLLVSIPSKDDSSGVYNIRLVESSHERISDLEQSFVQDMTCGTPFTPEIVDRERACRDLIRDRIASLPEDHRQARITHENDRQRRFNELWADHRQQGTPTILHSPPGSTSALHGLNQQPGGWRIHGKFVAWRRKRLKKLSLWFVSPS